MLDGLWFVPQTYLIVHGSGYRYDTGPLISKVQSAAGRRCVLSSVDKDTTGVIHPNLFTTTLPLPKAPVNGNIDVPSSLL